METCSNPGGRGRNSGGERGNFGRKMQPSKFNPKINLHAKFYPKWTMIKCSNAAQGRAGGKALISRKKDTMVTHAIQKLIYRPNFIRIRQWEGKVFSIIHGK